MASGSDSENEKKRLMMGPSPPTSPTINPGPRSHRKSSSRSSTSSSQYLPPYRANRSPSPPTYFDDNEEDRPPVYPYAFEFNEKEEMTSSSSSSDMEGMMGDGVDKMEMGLLAPIEPREMSEDEDKLREEEVRRVAEMEAGKGRKAGMRRFFVWMAVNTLATIGIVFTNKVIFSDPPMRTLQTAFAAFHFACTSLTLLLASRLLGLFVPRRLSIPDILPLAIMMCLNVILPNASLAYSSVVFYQIARILLTPLTAGINAIFFRIFIPRKAVLMLIPVLAGVGLVTYYDVLASSQTDAARDIDPTSGTAPLKSTSKSSGMKGLIFALSGVLASSLYTVLIGFYHNKTKLSSMQLLYNQAPLSTLLLLLSTSFIDTYPAPTSTSSGSLLSALHPTTLVLIPFSGFLAALINLSQFYIVAGAGATSSTVVGHLKTCCIVALGWITGGRVLEGGAVVGVLAALGGIWGYSWVMAKCGRKA